MPSLLSLLGLSILLWTGWCAWELLKNYRKAKRLGVPILLSPVGHTNVFWLATQDLLGDYVVLLPFGLGAWAGYTRRSWNWMFGDRGRIHQKYGPIIAHVSPSRVEIWTSDKDLINELLKGKDRAHFDKPREAVKVVDFLSPHLMTAVGDVWKRHRRIVASPFNQRNMRIVWIEALHQGLKLGERWFQSSTETGNYRTMWKDNETATLNVMVSAGFGMSRENLRKYDDNDDGSFSLHSSLFFMLHNFIMVIAIPSKWWFPKKLPPFPQALRDFFGAIGAFKKHVDAMVEDSKRAASGAELSPTDPSSYTKILRSDNLLASLVRHSEEMKQGSQSGSAPGKSYKDSLSDDEIVSNLFGLAFAGHETTAHTLAYSLYLMAANPPIQEWVAEEIRQVFKDSRTTNVESLTLDEAFPRLVRTRAVVYESLRLFTPLANVMKKSLSPQGDTLHVGSRTYNFPPGTYVLPSIYSLHVLPEYWGKDSLEWKPQRWVSIDSQGREEFVQPSPAGTFIPWSDGPRSCPGARFAQTELVAVCTALVSQYRLSVGRLEGEDERAAIGRVKSALDNSTIFFTLSVKEPEKHPLRLERRDVVA